MSVSSYLEKDEIVLLKEFALLGKTEMILVLTNDRIIFLEKSKEVINTIKYVQITKIQNSKPSDKEISENTISKIRIIDQKGIKTDFSFKGLESVNKSKKVTSLINKQRKLTENDNKKPDSKSQENQQPDHLNNKEIAKNANKKIMTENTLKAEFLDQNAAAKKMYKDLVVEEQILTEEEFWDNFKSEIAEHKALCQKNGFVFEENAPSSEPVDTKTDENQNNNELMNTSITDTKPQVTLPDFNVIKIEQDISNNADEFKPSITITDEIVPILPDDVKNEIEEEDEHEIERQDYFWHREVIKPLIDPAEFKEEAQAFLSNLEIFAESFNSLPEVSVPSMKDAKAIISEISDENYKRYNYQNITNPEIIIGLEILRKHKMEQQILLVHFWQNYEKDIENHNNREKTLRLRSKIEELDSILQNEKKNIKSKEARKALIPLYEEIEIPIYSALKKQPQ